MVVAPVGSNGAPNLCSARFNSMIVRQRKPSLKSRSRGTSTGRVRRRSTQILDDLIGVKRGQLLSTWNAQLATLTREAPDGDRWLHEVKFDGFRMGCRIERGQVRFISRNRLDWTDRFHSIARLAETLPAERAFLDGEVVALNSDGISDFQLLQNAFRGTAQQLCYYAFDLLHLDGYDLSGVPLEDRKRVLADLFPQRDDLASLRYSEHTVGNGQSFHRRSCAMGLEGIVSKLRS